MAAAEVRQQPAVARQICSDGCIVLSSRDACVCRSVCDSRYTPHVAFHWLMSRVLRRPRSTRRVMSQKEHIRRKNIYWYLLMVVRGSERSQYRCPKPREYCKLCNIEYVPRSASEFALQYGTRRYKSPRSARSRTFCVRHRATSWSGEVARRAPCPSLARCTVHLRSVERRLSPRLRGGRGAYPTHC